MQQHISHIKKYDLILTTGFQNEIGIFKEFGYDRHNKNFIVSINYITLTDSGTDYVSRINVRNSTEQRIFKITEDNLNTSQYNKYLKILSELKEGLVIFNNGRYGKVSFDEIKTLYIDGDFKKLTNYLVMSSNLLYPEAERIIIEEVRAFNIHYNDLIKLLLKNSIYQNKIL